ARGQGQLHRAAERREGGRGARESVSPRVSVRGRALLGTFGPALGGAHGSRPSGYVLRPLMPSYRGQGRRRAAATITTRIGARRRCRASTIKPSPSRL